MAKEKALLTDEQRSRLMTAKEKVLQWLADNGMSRVEMLSLAFIPESTYAEIFSLNRIAPKYRLWLLTDIDELKLTDDEVEAYGWNKKVTGSTVAIEEKIATRFINDYKTHQAFPELEYRLSAVSGKKKDKKLLIKLITKELFPDEAKKAEKKNRDQQQEAVADESLQTNDVAAQVMSDVHALNASLQQLWNAGTKQDFATITKSKKSLQKLYGTIYLLLDEKSYDAVSGVKEFTKNFITQKPTT